MASLKEDNLVWTDLVSGFGFVGLMLMLVGGPLVYQMFV